ncbi:MAG: ribosome rescue protein RqcH [Candidatus Thermoplasmatota archaeon]|nr:ribosome rescue protein RqcH [Candidatus Thermoplasmatota archaeon]
MSSIDIARIVQEIDSLVGARSKKMYQPHFEQIVLRMNPKEKSTRDLVIVRGKRVYFSQRDRPMPKQPAQFAMLLRKHLKNARLIGVKQAGFDRVIILDFDTKDGMRHLVIEMFRNGNVILLDENMVIIQPLTHATYETRTIKRGEIYAAPPEPINAIQIGKNELHEVLQSSDRNLLKTLTGKLSIGPIYAELICQQTGLNPLMNASEITDISSLHSTISEMFENILQSNSAIAIFENDISENYDSAQLQAERDQIFAENCVEICPLSSLDKASKFTIEFTSLSEAIDAWKGAYDASALARREAEKLSELTAPGQSDSEEEKLGRRERQQEAAVEKLSKKGSQRQELGKAIQNNWEHVESILNQFNAAVEKDGWDTARLALKKTDWVESADPSSRTIQAKLPTGDGKPGQTIELYLDETVHQNAQRYFAKGRKDKKRAEGAKVALEETLKKQKKVEKKRAQDAAAGRVSVTKRSKKFWFERNRWTILPSGQLFVGGRDAKGNDQIVKKHLSSNDLYFHADIHGAPSCSLKFQEGIEPDTQLNPHLPDDLPCFRLSQKLEIDETDSDSLEAAAQMAVCWSRAWGSGGGGATAFHAKPGQVSKTTETGESLGRGAFVVRGTRHWYRDVPLELTLGTIAINGIPLPLIGPHRVVSSMCKSWVKISPGTSKKEIVATKIAKATGLLQDDVLSALPPGNLTLGESQGIST